MDREHPIPQEISTYQFRLVGDMTIKQFMQVAAGALISLVLYSSNMEIYVKWPLIIISFLTGIALAFFPIEDRPLSTWIGLFIKAIYSPTVYVWDKNARRTSYFQAEPTGNGITATSTQPPATSVQVQTSGNQANEPSPTAEEFDKLDKKEEEFLEKVKEEFKSPNNIIPSMANTAASDTKNVYQSQIPEIGQKRVEIPKEKAAKVELQEKVKSQPIPPELNSQSQVGSSISPMASQNISNSSQAIFSAEASPPSPPTMANVVVRQVLDYQGKIIDGAILEIKDAQGRSVRALRTNRLGHFMIVTPLANGKYAIVVEREGYQFELITFEAIDRIIPPIAIRAIQ